MRVYLPCWVYTRKGKSKGYAGDDMDPQPVTIRLGHKETAILPFLF